MKHPLVLALASYEPTLWRIHAADPTQIVRVILGGYHSQSVSGLAAGTPVESHTHKPSDCGDCVQGEGYFYAYKRGSGGDYVRAVRELWKITGLRPTTFQGNYSGKRFIVSDRLRHLSYSDTPPPQKDRGATTLNRKPTTTIEDYRSQR
jgi:hypothetical protein